MTKTILFRFLLLVLVTGGLTSCSLTPSNRTAGSRFHEDAATDVVVKFFSWNSIHLTRPDSREEGFLPLLDRETVSEKLNRSDMGRDLAVVVFGYMFSKADESKLIDEWNSLLRERGFRRVVMLRAGFKDQIDGLLIINDSAMTAAHDAGKATATFAAVPTAAGADVADSSGASIR